MDWNTDISTEANETMKFLGNFGPTVHEHMRELKGYMHDDEGGGKVYLDAGDLREIAAACIEVADWLDKRADAVANAKVSRGTEAPEESAAGPTSARPLG